MQPFIDSSQRELLTKPLLAVHEGDLDAMRQFREDGWDVDAAVRYAPELTALNIAAAAKTEKALVWLLEQGAGVHNPEAPPLLIAARYGTPASIALLAAAGADVDAAFKVGGEAFQQAMYGRGLQNLQAIEDAGHRAARHGGLAFHSAIGKHNLTAAQWFLDHGVDIDFAQRDMVHPWAPTALGIVALYGTLDEARWLIERGADATKTDRDGKRPYSRAVERGDADLAAYLSAQEPPGFTSAQNGRELLAKYAAPATMRAYFESTSERIELPDSDLGWVELFTVGDLPELKIGRSTVLQLSRATGDVDHIVLIWDRKTKQVGWYDGEHGERGVLGSWDAFIADPNAAMAGLDV